MSTTPICRCRVLYLGSSVPHITKDGLQGIQEPLRELYPEQGPLTARGIDSWLSVWSNGLLLENVDESRREVTRFFPVETLHYCAAVRYMVVPGGGAHGVEKFLPLDSPFGHRAGQNSGHPPLFACILRRTEGIKVLECHAFICKKEAAANALVRCCFHAYADNIYARQMEENPYYLDTRRSRSMSGLNTLEKVEEWRRNHDDKSEFTTNGFTNGNDMTNDNSVQDDNYKVWTGKPNIEKEAIYSDVGSTFRSNQSITNKTRPRQMVLPSRPPPPLPADNNRGKPAKNPKPKQEPVSHMTNGHHYRSVSSMGRPSRHQNQIYATSGLYTERRNKRYDRAHLPAEEPLYMPSIRPTSPITSYQPSAFPHEQYYMQFNTAPRHHSRAPRRRRHVGPESPSEISQSEADSPFNTGIYKKKGHLNERAFSYSIRQEHTSRSNSLANLQFFANGDGPSGVHETQAEVTRMMANVDLNGSVVNGHGGRKKHSSHRK